MIDEQSQGQYLSDEDIAARYVPFIIEETRKDGPNTGGMQLIFPNGEDRWDNFTRYENGDVCFDNWYPDNIRPALVDAVNQTLDNPEWVVTHDERTTEHWATLLAQAIDRECIAKANALRVGNESVKMLKIALEALEKGKTHVVKDHVERVISYLTAMNEQMGGSK
jgi:hypothetical protein